MRNFQWDLKLTNKQPKWYLLLVLRKEIVNVHTTISVVFIEIVMSFIAMRYCKSCYVDGMNVWRFSSIQKLTSGNWRFFTLQMIGKRQVKKKLRKECGIESHSSNSSTLIPLCQTFYSGFDYACENPVLRIP
jgi:hypothetical protein